MVQDPEIVVGVDTTNLSVTTSSGVPFHMYSGMMFRYDQQYIIVLDGVVDSAIEQQLLSHVTTAWTAHMGGMLTVFCPLLLS